MQVLFPRTIKELQTLLVEIPQGRIMAGGTYASLLPALVAFGPKLPGTHTGAHGIDERLRIEAFDKALPFWDSFLRLLAGSNEGEPARITDGSNK